MEESVGRNRELKLVKLHENVELQGSVVQILNSEWPRSEAARYQSLEGSSDELPCALVLVSKDDSGRLKEVLGHSKLSKVHGIVNGVLIENVIVSKSRRGCGLGKKLMEMSESYAISLGYHRIYLSTHDKCKFYEHLGYQYSSPVSPIRANAHLLTPSQFAALQSHFGEGLNKDTEGDTKMDHFNKADRSTEYYEHWSNVLGDTTDGTLDQGEQLRHAEVCQSVTEKGQPPLPPIFVPPPPPPPVLSTASKTISDSGHDSQEKRYWMAKDLSRIL